MNNQELDPATQGTMQEMAALQILQSIGSRHGQGSEAHVQAAQNLMDQFADTAAADVEAAICVLVVRTEVNGEPGFKLAGGFIGSSMQLTALEMLIGGRLQAFNTLAEADLGAAQ